MKKIAFGMISLWMTLFTSICVAQQTQDLHRIELPNHVIQVTSLPTEVDDPAYIKRNSSGNAGPIFVSQEQYDSKFHVFYERNLKLTRSFFFGPKSTMIVWMYALRLGDGTKSNPEDWDAFKAALVKRQDDTLESLKRQPLKQSERFGLERIQDVSINGRNWAHYVTNAQFPFEVFDTPLGDGHFLRLSIDLTGDRKEFRDRSRAIVTELLKSITITPKPK